MLLLPLHSRLTAQWMKTGPKKDRPNTYRHSQIGIGGHCNVPLLRTGGPVDLKYTIFERGDKTTKKCIRSHDTTVPPPQSGGSVDLEDFFKGKAKRCPSTLVGYSTVTLISVRVFDKWNGVSAHKFVPTDPFIELAGNAPC